MLFHMNLTRAGVQPPPDTLFDRDLEAAVSDSGDFDGCTILKSFHTQDFVNGAAVEAGWDGDAVDAAGPWCITLHSRVGGIGRFVNPAAETPPPCMTVRTAYSGLMRGSDWIDGVCTAGPLVHARIDASPGSMLDRQARGATNDAAGSVMPAGLEPVRGALCGTADMLRLDQIEGRVRDAANPEELVTLSILVDDGEIATSPADGYCDDLGTAGTETGRDAFLLGMPWLSDAVRHVIAVRRAADGCDVHSSPAPIEPSAGFDAGLEEELAAAVDGLAAGAEQDRLLSFLTTQTEKLLLRRATEQAGPANRGHLRVVPSPQADPLRPLVVTAAGRPHALVIGDTLPAPGRGFGSNAILAHMHALQEQNYAVSFVAAQDPAPCSTQMAAAEALEAFGIACWRGPFYVSVEEVVKRWASSIEIVYLHRLTNFGAYLALIRQYLPQARILFSPVDQRAAFHDGIRWSEIDAGHYARGSQAGVRPAAGAVGSAVPEFAAD